jgi:hypothetical protein
VGDVSAPVQALSALLGVVAVACGTVAPGQDIQFAEVAYDQNYFYCKVEPMLIEQGCGPGGSGDVASGCHYNVTTFRLTKHDPVPCQGVVPRSLSVPAGAESNYQAAAREMSPDPERAPLLNRPTRKAAHPRQIFADKTPQAAIIREWATKYTSQ